MHLTEFLLTLLALALPVTCLSWLLFHRLYDSGELDRRDNRRALGKSLKAIKKNRKREGAPERDFIHTRWMKFGGGFYGITALWTFVVIEANDITTFVSTFPGLVALFEDGLLNLLVSALVNQIMNLSAP